MYINYSYKRTYVVNGLVIKHVLGDDLLDDLLLDLLSELFGGNVLAVLGGDNDGINAERNNGTAVVGVLNGDLGLGVGPQPGKRAVLAGVGHRRIQLVGEEDGKREELGGLVGGISEHDTLVTSTELFESFFIVQTLGDVGRLLLNGNEYVAGLVVEALVGRVVANVLDGVADDLLVVEVCLCGNLAEDHNHTGLGGRLTGDLGQRVLLEAGIEDSVGDLIAAIQSAMFGESRGGSGARHIRLIFGHRPSEEQLSKLRLRGKRKERLIHTISCRGGPRRQTQK
jgi:hypothetical protein